jgi:hypothetical protein
MICPANLNPKHDLFIRHARLENTLRKLAGQEEELDRSGFADETAEIS